jgi:hypothetical protein
MRHHFFKLALLKFAFLCFVLLKVWRSGTLYPQIRKTFILILFCYAINNNGLLIKISQISFRTKYCALGSQSTLLDNPFML